ncbi:MAG: hypothetical protein ACRDL7_02535, partial [Gaiellaceae bacterium]
MNTLSKRDRRWIIKGRQAERDEQGDRKVSASNSAKPETETKEEGGAETPNASSKFGRASRNVQDRQQSGLQSSPRRIGGQSATIRNRYARSTDYGFRGRLEVDSRADTLCAGKTFVPLETTDRVCDVSGFHPEFRKLAEVPVVTSATAYDSVDLQETLVLVFPQSLYFGEELEHSLFPPNQVRDNGIVVDTCPRQYSNGESLHGIYHPDENVTLPFVMHGCISYLPTRLPTDVELRTCRYVYLTSEAEWEPYSDKFKNEEKKYGKAFEGDRLVAHEHHEISGRRAMAVASKDHRSRVDSVTLARRWGISDSAAKATLQVTTQRGVRQMQPTTDRRYRTRQAQLRYPYLRTRVYSDTMFSDKKTLMAETCGQLFVTAEGFSRIYPMKTKSEAGYKLNKFVQSVGIPHQLVVDNAQEEQYGEWGRVVKHYLIDQKWTEPGSPWQNQAEREIKELKAHFRRIMNRSQCPERLWNFGIKYTSDLRANLSRPPLEGRTPVEVTTGDTPDISELLDYEFYQWVKYRELGTRFPEQRMELGRWLGIAHDVGQAMCY